MAYVRPVSKTSWYLARRSYTVHMQFNTTITLAQLTDRVAGCLEGLLRPVDTRAAFQRVRHLLAYARNRFCAAGPLDEFPDLRLNLVCLFTDSRIISDRCSALDVFNGVGCIGRR